MINGRRGQQAALLASQNGGEATQGHFETTENRKDERSGDCSEANVETPRRFAVLHRGHTLPHIRGAMAEAPNKLGPDRFLLYVTNRGWRTDQSIYTKMKMKSRVKNMRGHTQGMQLYHLPSATNLEASWRFSVNAFILMLLLGLSEASGARFVDIGLEAVDSPSIVRSPATLFENGRSFALALEGKGECPWITSSSYYSGARAIGTRVSPDSTKKDRSEIKVVRGSDRYALHFGQTRYFGFAMHVDNSSSDWPLERDVIFMQAWQGNCGPKVPLTASLQAGTGDHFTPLTFKVVAHENQVRFTLLNSRPITKGWHTFLFKMRPSYDKMGGKGQVDLWLDGVKILMWSHNWGIEPGMNLGFGSIGDNWSIKCGIYRPRPANQNLVLIFDNIRYADNFYDAMP